MSFIYIFEKSIPYSFEQEIYDTFTRINFPWYGLNLTTYHEVETSYENGDLVRKDYYFDENTFEYYHLTHLFMEDDQIISPYYPIIKKFINYINIDQNKIESIVKVKANLQTFYKTDKLYNPPHYDYYRLTKDKKVIKPDDKYVVGIYHVNDSDGFTYIFENDEKPFKISHKVESKKGQLILMDGSVLHAGSHPKTGYRIVLNFLIKLKNDI
jgi:hypothetical protein